MERLILDTGVLIAYARRRLDPSDLPDDGDAALPALVAAEYLAGVERDENLSRAAAQRALLERMLTILPVLDYTLDVARHHAQLLAYTSKDGRPRGPHDLIIAATARATDRMLVTTDAKADFGGLPGVAVRVAKVLPRP